MEDSIITHDTKEKTHKQFLHPILESRVKRMISPLINQKKRVLATAFREQFDLMEDSINNYAFKKSHTSIPYFLILEE